MNNRHYVHSLFIIVLIGIFALSSVGMALLGVNIYRTASTSDSEDLTTASLYFTQKVHQCGDKGMVRVTSIGNDSSALVISANEGGKDVETWFFVDKGSLKEVTVTKGSDVDPQFGQEIMDMKSVNFKLVTKRLLQISLTTSDGNSDTVNLALIGGANNE